MFPCYLWDVDLNILLATATDVLAEERQKSFSNVNCKIWIGKSINNRYRVYFTIDKLDVKVGELIEVPSNIAFSNGKATFKLDKYGPRFTCESYWCPEFGLTFGKVIHIDFRDQYILHEAGSNRETYNVSRRQQQG